jgi:hypothetical protein
VSAVSRKQLKTSFEKEKHSAETNPSKRKL